MATHTTSTCPSYTTPEMCTLRTLYPRRSLHIHVHCCSLHNGHEVESAHVSITDDKDVLHIHMGFYSTARTNEIGKFTGKWMGLKKLQ